MNAHTAASQLMERFPNLSERTIETFSRGVDAALAATQTADQQNGNNQVLGKAFLQELESRHPDECGHLIAGPDSRSVVCPCFQWVAAERFEGKNGFRGLMTRYLSAILLGNQSAVSAVLWTLDWQSEPFDRYWRQPLNAVWSSGREVIVVQYERYGRQVLFQFPPNTN